MLLYAMHGIKAIILLCFLQQIANSDRSMGKKKKKLLQNLAKCK